MRNHLRRFQSGVKLRPALKGLVLPLLAAAFPILFLYRQNAWELIPSSLFIPMAATLLLVALIYAVFLLSQRRPHTAALSAVVFVVLYYFYGTIFRRLLKLDTFPVEHFTLLPLGITLVWYISLLIARLRTGAARALYTALLVPAALLVTYNLGSSGWIELQKIQTLGAKPVSAASHRPVDENLKRPDIYYIVFDEYAGFDVIRDYWKEDYVDEFEDFLEAQGFFIADQSRSKTLSTITELTSRLEMMPYPEKTDAKITLNAISRNRVMRVLKEYGYTTVALDMSFPIDADYSLGYDPAKVAGMAADEFRQEFLDQTMFSAAASVFNASDPKLEEHREGVRYTLERTANLGDIPGPKFVYTHLLLPHQPFVFDENGEPLDPTNHDNWNVYLEQHKYATKVMREMVTQILSQYGEDNQPVIILQSDHGARNLKRRTKDSDRVVLNGYLENYPIDNAYHILNALYLPGFEPSTLPRDLPPIETFVVVLNHYFDAGVQVQSYIPGPRRE